MVMPGPPQMTHDINQLDEKSFYRALSLENTLRALFGLSHVSLKITL